MNKPNTTTWIEEKVTGWKAWAMAFLFLAGIEIVVFLIFTILSFIFNWNWKIVIGMGV